MIELSSLVAQSMGIGPVVSMPAEVPLVTVIEVVDAQEWPALAVNGEEPPPPPRVRTYKKGSNKKAEKVEKPPEEPKEEKKPSVWGGVQGLKTLTHLRTMPGYQLIRDLDRAFRKLEAAEKNKGTLLRAKNKAEKAEHRSLIVRAFNLSVERWPYTQEYVHAWRQFAKVAGLDPKVVLWDKVPGEKAAPEPEEVLPDTTETATDIPITQG